MWVVFGRQVPPCRVSNDTRVLLVSEHVQAHAGLATTRLQLRLLPTGLLSGPAPVRPIRPHPVVTIEEGSDLTTYNEASSQKMDYLDFIQLRLKDERIDWSHDTSHLSLFASALTSLWKGHSQRFRFRWGFLYPASLRRCTCLLPSSPSLFRPSVHCRVGLFPLYYASYWPVRHRALPPTQEWSVATLYSDGCPLSSYLHAQVPHII